MLPHSTMGQLPNMYLKKSYEAGYALFRLAGTLPERTYKAHLEDKALDIIVAALEENRPAGRRAIHVAEYLVRFLRDVGIVHGETAELIIRSLSELDAATAESGKPTPEPLSNEFLFPESLSRSKEPALLDSGKHNSASPQVIELPDALPNTAVLHGNGSSEDFNARKVKILEKVRSSGVCRLRDFQEVLKEVSERTLRYDLQRLAGEGSIERVGTGGPGTFYRLSTANPS